MSTVNTVPQSVGEEWRKGWSLVFASTIGFSFFAAMIGSTGLFMEPLEKEFGWSRTLLSSGPSIATAVTAILAPLFGILVDRFGTRRLVLPGVTLSMISVCAFGLLDGEKWQWMLLWLLYGLVAVSIKSTAWTAAVLSVFDKSKGLALGLTLSGSALSQTLMPPLGNWLITDLGWRAAYVWIGLGWGGVTLLLCVLFFFDKRDRERGRLKREPAKAKQTPPPADLPGLTLKEAWRDTALWRVGISNFIVLTLTVGLSLHLFPILTEAGMSRADAAWLTALAGVAGIFGKLVTGWLLDRFRPNWVGGITLGVAAVTFAFLMDGVRSPVLLVIALMVNGYTSGTKTQITAYLTAGYGGMRHFGVLYGVMSAVMAVASGVGPLLAGYIYDTSGSYEPFLMLGAIIAATGGIIIATLPRYPDWEARGRAGLA